MDEPEMHRDLWWPQDGLDSITPLSDQREPPEIGEPWQVGRVKQQGRSEHGRSIFRHRLPAIKFTDYGPGGRSHLVQQVTAAGAQVVRRLHATEVDRLFASARVRVEWGKDEERQARQGNSAPPDMILPILQGLVAFCKPTCDFVPKSVDCVITPAQVLAYRGQMAALHTDFVELRKRGLLNVPPGEGYRRNDGHSDKAADGGIVFRTEVPMPFYLGEFWVTNDVDDIVPAAYLTGASTISKDALAALARFYSDQKLVQCMTGTGVPSKDKSDPRVAFLASNHQKAYAHHGLVHEMYAEELAAGRMLQFGAEQSPVFFPSTVSPTGATVKKDREGRIDPNAIRPTADYSWPPANHWLRWLVQSPNESVDLENDFPWVYYATTRDFMEQVLFLDALGSGVS